MYLFKIDCYATTASFRIPESHTFQQTLPLPPLTTIIGLVGAALGLSYEDAMIFTRDNGIKFGVSGSYSGEFKDLWKYNKIKSSYKGDGSDQQDILIREHLFDVNMTIIVGSDNSSVVSQSRMSVLNPVYALTIGNSDSLIKIRSVSEIAEFKAKDCSDFENTILPGDHSGVYEPLIKIEDLAITESIRSPRVYLLPTDFDFKGEERRVNRREMFTFIGSPIRLFSPIPAYLIDGKSYVLL